VRPRWKWHAVVLRCSGCVRHPAKCLPGRSYLKKDCCSEVVSRVSGALAFSWRRMCGPLWALEDRWKNNGGEREISSRLAELTCCVCFFCCETWLQSPHLSVCLCLSLSLLSLAPIKLPRLSHDTPIPVGSCAAHMGLSDAGCLRRQLLCARPLHVAGGGIKT